MKQRHFDYDIDDDVADVISRLGSNVESFNGKTILITGGTGFFGRWLLQILCTLISERQFKINVYVLSRNPSYFIHNNKDYPFDKLITFIQGDITNFDFPNVELDYLIHMATTAAAETFNGEDQLRKLELLYKGTKNVLELAVARGVKKVLFTSSGVAYGPSNGSFLSEDMLSAPQTTNVGSALGEGKRLAEYLVAYYSSKFNFKFSIARCFAFYGPYLPLDIHYAIGNFVFDALYKDEIVIQGSGKDLRSYLYIADAWVWFLKMLSEADDETYNVGSSQSISIHDLANLVRKLLAPEKKVKLLGAGQSVGNFIRSVYVPNNDKIINGFGVSEWTKLSSGILKMGMMRM